MPIKIMEAFDIWFVIGANFLCDSELKSSN